MFLTKLQLTNFRCFSELEIDFTKDDETRQRTLILGQNGTGKSNILKAIALVTAGSNALGELLGNPNDWIKFGQQHCRIDLEMATQKRELRKIWLEIHLNDSLSMVMKRSDKSLQEIDNALNHTDRNYFVVGYGASRTMSRNSRRSSDSSSYYGSQRAQCVSSLLDRQASLNSITDWAMDLDYRNEKGGLSIIRKVFDDFLPGIKFKHIDKEKRQLILDTPDGDVPLDSLSDGYQNMASWIGDLLFRITSIFRERKNPLNSTGVLLLDEIDLHLHPIWQRELLKFIQDTLPNMQLIATTHSPFTAQQAGEGELFTLERKNSSLKIEQFAGNPQKLLLHQLIMSDVFGLETDESLYVQTLKEEHQELERADNKSSSQRTKLKKIEATLKDIPIKSYSNSLITEQDRSLMKEMLKSYSSKKRGDAKAE